MGGGNTVNAYYRSAEQMGVQIRYNTPVQALELRDGRMSRAGRPRRIAAKTCVSPPAVLNLTARVAARS